MSTRFALSPLYRRLLVSSVNELGYSNGASRWSRVAFMTASLTMAVSSVGLYLFARDPYSGNEIRRLITESYNAQRPGGGRLHQSQYSHQPIRRLRTLIWERHSFFYCDSPIRTPDSGFRVCSISPPEIGENMSTLSSTFQPECARSPVC